MIVWLCRSVRRPSCLLSGKRLRVHSAGIVDNLSSLLALRAQLRRQQTLESIETHIPGRPIRTYLSCLTLSATLLARNLLPHGPRRRTLRLTQFLTSQDHLTLGQSLQTHYQFRRDYTAKNLKYMGSPTRVSSHLASRQVLMGLNMRNWSPISGSGLQGWIGIGGTFLSSLMLRYGSETSSWHDWVQDK